MGELIDQRMKNYYAKRAPVYDKVYSYPERQKDLRYLEGYISGVFEGLEVLEIAAGTGYWTQFINSKAKSILATDATKEALKQIRLRPNCENLPTKVLDAYSLSKLNKRFNGLFSGLWLSHIPKQKLNVFFNELDKVLSLNAKVVFIDNSIAQCNRLPISSTDEFGNTYQKRMLDDGSKHKILKNFPNADELLNATRKHGSNQRFEELENYWIFEYEKK